MNSGGHMSVKWQKKFATGVVEIDCQHQELFSKLDDLLDAVENKKGQKVLLDIYSFLDTYTRKHFAAEEGLQRKFNYPHMALHCEEHKSFLKNLEHMKVQLTADGPTDAMVNLTRDTLVNWLINHVCSTDQHLGDFVKVHRNSQWEEWMRLQF
jgi:hemerythrin